MGIFSDFLGDNLAAYRILLYPSFLKKGDEMRKKIFSLALLVLAAVNISGCIPLIIGATVGGVSMYAVGKDTIVGDTDKPYESLWDAALKVSRIRGTIKSEDSVRGYLEVEAESSKAWIRFVRLTRAATRVRVSARNKFHLPNLSLAQDIFVKIMEETK